MPLILILLISLASSLGFHYKFELSYYETASLFVSIAYLLYFIKNLGNKVLIIEIIGLSACILWLTMPLFFYHHFDESNYLARLWKIYMYVPSDRYYHVVFWGTITLLAGLHFPFPNMQILPAKEYIDRIRNNNQNYNKISLIILVLSSIGILFSSRFSGSLAQVFEILSNFIFVAAFYAYFTNSLNRVLYLSVVIVTILGISIAGGMFGKLVFAGALSVILLMAVWKRKLSFTRKFSYFLVGFVLLLLLQSIKYEFRRNTWGSFTGYTGYSGSKTILFIDLIAERIKNPSFIYSDEYQLYALATRFNQGWLISKAIDYIPAQKPYAGPGPLTAAILGGFIPRFLWPDKPEAGGKANMLRYTGVKLTTVSMNVSPIGEAYGSFGTTGAWVFMFFLGLFLRWSFLKIMVIAKTYPTLILWLPSIYVMTVVVETDVLTIFNAFIKSVFLVWLMYQLFYKLWRIRL